MLGRVDGIKKNEFRAVNERSTRFHCAMIFNQSNYVAKGARVRSAFVEAIHA